MKQKYHPSAWVVFLQTLSFLFITYLQFPFKIHIGNARAVRKGGNYAK